jgi:hypothetical protein
MPDLSSHATFSLASLEEELYLQTCRVRSGGVRFLGLVSSVADVDFDFQNRPVRVVLVREIPFSHPLTEPLQSVKIGQEAEVPYWTADELVRGGFAKYIEDEVMDLSKLSKTHWKETIPTSTQLPSLEADFYCMLRSFLGRLKAEGMQDPSKLREYEKAENLSRDVVNCRLRKIASFAAALGPSSDLLKNMTSEEQALYKQLRAAISEWKSSILGK